MNCFKAAGLADKDKQRYTKNFDPQVYLDRIKTPILFIAGADDVAFTMQSRKKTTDRLNSEKRFSYRKNLPHGHSAGWSCEEAMNFVSSKLLKEEYPTVEITVSGKNILINRSKSLLKSQLVYTEKCFNEVCGDWQNVDFVGDVLTLPENCKYFFVSAMDNNGFVYSTDVYEL
jgi:PhoPQ-activated pathogenicity-related protein